MNIDEMKGGAEDCGKTMHGDEIPVESEYFGCYVIGGNIYFYLNKRPSKWHQFWARVFLGWEWVGD